MVQLKTILPTPTFHASGLLHQWIAAIIGTYLFSKRKIYDRIDERVNVIKFSATLGIFSLGGVLGWTSPAFPSMVGENNGHFQNITEDHKSWIGSIATV